MDEEQLARFYESRRDDTSLWEEKPSKANVRRGGSVVFSIRLDPHELALLREKAQQRHTTVSQLVRRAAITEATKDFSTDVLALVMGPIPEYRPLPVYTATLGLETGPFPNLILEPNTARQPTVVLFPSH
jgi:hypothetical protein